MNNTITIEHIMGGSYCNIPISKMKVWLLITNIETVRSRMLYQPDIVAFRQSEYEKLTPDDIEQIHNATGLTVMATDGDISPEAFIFAKKQSTGQ